MKLAFNIIIVSFFSTIFISSPVFSKTSSAEYLIKVGGIGIGKVFWSVIYKKENYKINIKLQDKGVFSGIYKFEGNYSTEGIYKDGKMIPTSYKQEWKTKKKKRNVEIFFTNKVVTNLTIAPKETEHARIDIKSVKNLNDPLTSFLNIINNDKVSKTTDGRRLYKMVLKNNQILIEDYFNIWADHKKKDLKFIEFKYVESGVGVVLPEKIKIKFKNISFVLTKN